MQVLDASAVVEMLLRTPRGDRVAARLAADTDAVAPDLVYVEALFALHRLVRAGTLTGDGAAELASTLGTMPLRTVPHDALLEGVWRIRDHVRIADAFYVVCALLLGVPLLTTDARLGRAALPGVTVTTVR